MSMSFNTISSLPKSLDALDKKVKKLFFVGDEDLLKKPLVAIVGSRRPNAYTKRIVTHLASALAKRDVYVISGLAMGVDAIAHMGAYPKTVGVLGNSLDIIYPKVNKDLILKMQKSSLILSEYEPNTKATPWSFVERNRIVVALSSAVVVAQADEKSGSMHSARIANKLQKPLYVLPQRLDESKGTNLLLAQEKAKLIYDIEEFANQFGTIKTEDDELIEFCKKNPLLDDALKRFGDRVYEYELEGKIQINGVHVRILG